MSKIAVITGASRGLGRQAALSLAERGVGSVVLYHQSEGPAREVVHAIEDLGQRACALRLDTTEVSAFPAFAEQLREALAATWGETQFDYLINNAGYGVFVNFTDTTEAQLDQMYAVHVKGPFLLTQTLLPLIKDGGRVLNVSSGLTRFSMPGYSAYAAMKGAVEVLTRYQAKELGARQIRVNTLAPGAIETDFGGGAVRDNAELNNMIAAQTALGRVGHPEDIGGAVVALLQDESGWINGQRIEASGGMLL